MRGQERQDLPNSGAVCPTENITVASEEAEGDEVNEAGGTATREGRE